jgi:monoamine oxidase
VGVRKTGTHSKGNCSADDVCIIAFCLGFCEVVMVNEVDEKDMILIIGAGAAGISAARYFLTHNVPFKMIDASHRVGGRAYSEPYQSGGWFDLGCSYLHEGEINPLVPLARDLGFVLGNGDRFKTDQWRMQQDRKGFNRDVLDGYIAYQRELYQRMAEFSGAVSKDVSFASLMDFSSPYAAIHTHLMAGLNASDADDQSVSDHLNVNDGKDYPVLGGLGQLVKTIGAGLPVILNCKAEKIMYSNNCVHVETNKGTITASKVIITASTGIMSSGMIKFSPALPLSYQDAFVQLKCGTLNKIGVALKPEATEGLADGWHVNFPGPTSKEETFASVDVILGEYPQAVIFAGGSFGEYLERQGREAMIDYANQCLADLFGASIKSNITDHITTAWHTEPWSLGSYSYAVPGGSPARQTLSEPIDQMIYFAGEAISIHHYGTCHGAYLSGLKAAKDCVKSFSARLSH